jgi:GNAT superfamily N-acetyltransferase
MQVTRFYDPKSFLLRAESFLLRAEAENNLLLGLAGRAVGADAYLATVTAGDDVVACGLRRPPHKAVITRAVRPALECLVADLAERYPDLPAVIGPEPDVAVFAELWAQRTGASAAPGMRQRMFEIRDAPTLETWPPGGLRPAEERDLPLLNAWSAAFMAEALPGERVDPEKHAARRISERSVFVWEDGRPVSMAGWAGRTVRGVRVNFVYTPPEFRRRRYATACVARVTQQLLDEGRAFCCLYTDVSNPTSNSIYRRIGYRPICEVSDYVLKTRQVE